MKSWVLLVPFASSALLIPVFAQFGHAGNPILGNAFLSFHLKYQSALLAAVLASLAFAWAVSRAQFQGYFRIGVIQAPATATRWLGIRAGERWSGIGANMLAIISIATIACLFFQTRGMALAWPVLFRNFHWVLLFSLLNAFSEEMIFRFGPVAALSPVLPATGIAMLSASAFGLAHAGGTPGGGIGIVLAGAMGFILCKSLLETRGLFWAILIHFVQDVLILSSLLIAKPA